MNRRRFIVGIGCASMTLVGEREQARLAAAEVVRQGQTDPRLYRRSGKALGTTITLSVLHGEPQQAARAMDAAFAELERIEAVMSLFRPESQLSRLNRNGVLHSPHPYLLEVLRLAENVARHSGGAFDVTVQPLWQLYAAAPVESSLPTPAALERALTLVDWRDIQLDADWIRLRRTGAAVTLNGIAQGFATDRVTATLRDHGVEHALIDAGELGAIGARGENRPWRTGIQHPRHPDAYISLAQLQDRCLATSGDYETTFSSDFAFHHIVDPRTGHCPRELASVSVVAPTAALADALSTAIMVLGTEQGDRLRSMFAGTEMFVVDKQGRCQLTSGFPLVKPEA